jgi:NADH:ubiquinone oxidoreductase subunit 6 (subunit J)
LFNDWFLILELSSILLLATIVGCLVLLKFREEID